MYPLVVDRGYFLCVLCCTCSTDPEIKSRFALQESVQDSEAKDTGYRAGCTIRAYLGPIGGSSFKDSGSRVIDDQVCRNYCPLVLAENSALFVDIGSVWLTSLLISGVNNSALNNCTARRYLWVFGQSPAMRHSWGFVGIDSWAVRSVV